MKKKLHKRRRILPGFGLSMGVTITYLSLIVIIPLLMLFVRSSGMGWEPFFKTIANQRVLASYWLSLYTAFFSALANVAIGLITAWVLVRYRFPGRKILDAIVDLPFALPTAVAGISLTALFASTGWVGHYLEEAGIHVVNTPVGITIALIFIGFPFVVRSVQPVLQELEAESEEAALSLGANRWQVFWRVTFPNLIPSLMTGFTLAFARTIGEYGSVIFIAGNIPYKTEITPLLIMIKLDQFDVKGAAAIALTLLMMSFFMLLLLNMLQWWRSRRLQVK